MVVIGKLFSVLRRDSKLGRHLHCSAVVPLSSRQRLQRTEVQCAVPMFRQAIVHCDLTAVLDAHGRYGYHGLLLSSCRFARDVSHYLDGQRQQRVAILCPRDASYVITQWACWISGHAAVPMPDDAPLSLLQHYVMDSQAKLVVTTRHHARLVAKLCLATGSKLLIMDDVLLEKAREGRSAAMLHTIGSHSEHYDREDALVIYTPDTTGVPKGTVFSHQALQSQVSALIRAWGLSESDGVLHVSPLHHLSGNVNVLACPLTVGATCVMLPKLDAAQVWSHLLYNKHVNIFMASPSVYSNLIQEYDRSLKEEKDKIKAALSDKIRLMVSECAGLPWTVSQRWQEISGHAVLDSSGSAETSMVDSNPLAGPRQPDIVQAPRVSPRCEA